MAKNIITRAGWIFITLADLVAATSLIELFDPKEHDVAFVWNATYDWLSMALGLACTSILIAAISVTMQGSAKKSLNSPTVR
jgi:hypothetical protein